MKDLLTLVGGKCRKGNPIKVLQSAAGYYVGTTYYDEDAQCEFPNCRMSYYGSSNNDPEISKARGCAENCRCNGTGKPGGCVLSADIK